MSGSDVLPIPQILDDVTPEWLTAALTEAGVLTGGRVGEATSARIGQEYGFTGVIGRIRVSYENATGDLPGSLVVKLPMALDEAASGFRKAQERDAARMRRHYDRCAREERFYREIGASFAPRVYYSAADEVRGRVVFLFEDLSGGRQGDVLQGCSVDDVAHVIDELAPFHARHWEGRAPVHGFEPMRAAPAARQERYAHVLELFLDRHGDALSPDVLRIARRLGTRLGAVAEKLHEGRKTLIHGDLHLDNLIFDHRRDDRPVVILDWQIAAVGPPASDVALLICDSLGVEERRAGETDLLDRYLTLLFEHDVRDYSAADLRSDCELALLLILAGTIGGLTTVDRSELTARELALQENALAAEGRLVSRIANARQLAAAAVANLDVDPELSILLGRQAVEEATVNGSPLPDAVESLHRALAAARGVLLIRTPATAALAVSANGSRLATAGAKTVDVRDATSSVPPSATTARSLRPPTAWAVSGSGGSPAGGSCARSARLTRSAASRGARTTRLWAPGSAAPTTSRRRRRRECRTSARAGSCSRRRARLQAWRCGSRPTAAVSSRRR
jgi:Ecdysteroid kinase-like family